MQYASYNRAASFYFSNLTTMLETERINNFIRAESEEERKTNMKSTLILHLERDDETRLPYMCSLKLIISVRPQK